MYTPLTSPQQTSQSMLTSYQTPPQPQQHQLYISATSSGESTGPNSSSTTATTSSSVTTSSPTEHKSPQAHHYSPGPYMVYPPAPPLPQNTYAAPPNFHSPLPTSSSPYMMYAQPPPPMQTQSFVSPTNANASNYKPHNNRQNRFNKYNNSVKKSYHQQSFKSVNPTSSEHMPQFAANSANVSCCEENHNIKTHADMVEQSSQSAFSCVAPSLPSGMPLCSPHMMNGGFEYYDPNTLVQMGINPMTYDYGHSAITTYGEDVYDENYDDNSNLENENEEQLACYVCRGRRMCFCYFLKVRYYKFPSFFDLVDHQYKKWRQTMNKNKRAAAPQC